MTANNLTVSNSMPKILKWKEVREDVKKVNFSLANAIDDIDSKDEINFCKVDYPFGAPIFDEGKLFVPNKNNRFVPINDSTVSEHYREYLGNDSAPLGIVLKNSISNSFEIKNDLSSLAVFYPGQLFGLRELFDSNHYLLNKEYWRLYSGARAIFSTTEIADQEKYKVIKNKLNLKSQLPGRLADHFLLFRELINHPHFLCDWSTTLLFFSKKIQDKLIQGHVWEPLQEFFLKDVWEQASRWNFDAAEKIIWSRVAYLLKDARFEDFEHKMQILKHATKMALGYWPCFVSDDRAETAAPERLLKEILIDEYGVDFNPTIMVPGYISKDRCHSGYYSVNEPIYIGESPRANKGKKITVDFIRSTQEIYQFARDALLNGHININNKKCQNLFKEIELKFFHTTPDKDGVLSLAADLPSADPSLVRLPKKHEDSNLPFDNGSSFFKGLIKIETDFSDEKYIAKGEGAC
jgi:hypothetical protein